jgi:hypothetical protein
MSNYEPKHEEALEIVKMLAKSKPYLHRAGFTLCGICGATSKEGQPVEHHSICPLPKAVMWLEAYG